MTRNSLKNQIFNLLKREYPNWVASGRIEKLGVELNFMPSNATRRARDLRQEGVAEYRKVGVSGEYRFKPAVEPELTREEEQQRLLNMAIM